MKPVTWAQWYRPLITETTAMMRRKNTRRRVQALSSDSIRSDEIAATEMALSRDWSRDGVSDMAKAVHDRELFFMAGNSWALAAAKSIRTRRWPASFKLWGGRGPR